MVIHRVNHGRMLPSLANSTIWLTTPVPTLLFRHINAPDTHIARNAVTKSPSRRSSATYKALPIKVFASRSIKPNLILHAFLTLTSLVYGVLKIPTILSVRNRAPATLSSSVVVLLCGHPNFRLTLRCQQWRLSTLRYRRVCVSSFHCALS